MEKWTDEDVQALLNIYAEETTQKEFETSARNAKVYQKISARLGELGIQHSAQRCREKIKKMKQDYKKIKDYNRVNGSNRRSGKWFERLDAILGQRGVDSGCGESGESGDCVSVLLEPLTDAHRSFLHHKEEEEEEKVSFIEGQGSLFHSFIHSFIHELLLCPTCNNELMYSQKTNKL